MVILSILIFQARSWEIFLLSAFICAVCFISRVKFSEIREALRPLVSFAVLLFILHLFFTDGTPLLQIPYLPVKITGEGLVRGLLISWQFLALALSGAILTVGFGLRTGASVKSLEAHSGPRFGYCRHGFHGSVVCADTSGRV